MPLSGSNNESQIGISQTNTTTTSHTYLSLLYAKLSTTTTQDAPHQETSEFQNPPNHINTDSQANKRKAGENPPEEDIDNRNTNKFNDGEKPSKPFQLPNTLASAWKPSPPDVNYLYGKETCAGYNNIPKPSAYVGNWFEGTAPKTYIPHKELVGCIVKWQRDMLEQDPSKYVLLTAPILCTGPEFRALIFRLA
ncbi:hypothetical protein L218DRAFT_1009996 [Marasmius fiardii PR-910]|nr:hypothetical protein L218DRAFT_1009996 [Marasmius fiardii PR-910]